jgi:hypothetical protein
MRKIGIIAVLSLMALALAAVPAFAGNPHFIKNATSATQSGTTVTVAFKEAGLAAGTSETVTASSTATTTYACQTNAGTYPNAANKQTTKTQASTSGVFPVDQNGNISGTLTISAPTAEQNTLVCPPGQTETLQSVSFSDVTLTSSPSGAKITVPVR